jgi:Ca2+-binding EF-hand superfamily protein
MRLPNPAGYTRAAIVAGCLSIVLIAYAQEGRGPERGGERGNGRGGFPSVGFTALDTNGDGTLDAAEIDTAPAVLAKLDKNADGQITAEEVRPAFPQRREGGEGGEGRRGPGRGPEGGPGGSVVEDMVKSLMAFDANVDGKLSKSELPERMQGIFNRADENHDGFLTADEIRKLAAAQASATQAGGPREGGRERGPRGEINFIRMDPILAAIDTNSDGILSSVEIQNAAKSLRTLDLDGDGKITREELMTAMRRRREAEPRDRDNRP